MEEVILTRLRSFNNCLSLSRRLHFRFVQDRLFKCRNIEIRSVEWVREIVRSGWKVDRSSGIWRVVNGSVLNENASVRVIKDR